MPVTSWRNGILLPGIKPTYADNFDLTAEHFFGNIGFVSAGVFYKNLKDLMFSSRDYETIDTVKTPLQNQSKHLFNTVLYYELMLRKERKNHYGVPLKGPGFPLQSCARYARSGISTAIPHAGTPAIIIHCY